MHLNTPEHLIAFYTRTQHASTSYCLLHTHPTRQHILLPPIHAPKHARTSYCLLYTHPTRQHILLPPTHAPNTPAHLTASYTRTQHASTSYCLLHTHPTRQHILLPPKHAPKHARTSYCLLYKHPTRQHILLPPTHAPNTPAHQPNCTFNCNASPYSRMSASVTFTAEPSLLRLSSRLLFVQAAAGYLPSATVMKFCTQCVCVCVCVCVCHLTTL